MKTERAKRSVSIRAFRLAGLLALAVIGCSNIREVPFTVTSDPPGSYILLQTLLPDADMYDWLYLGTTPLNLVRPMDFRELKKTETVTLKAMKEGYFEQVRSWPWKRFVREFKEDGGISWDPHLVPMSGGDN